YLELTKLYNYITDILPTLEPSLNLDINSHFLNFDLISTCTGKVLKSTEDKLDSIICAYVAAYWWYWGEQRNLVLGDVSTGYIVIPYKVE
ncbi:DUF429 domain-containing protein, partial [Rivularia sp. UHCC 0363]|nr:DUF429 domain-containing protein [Rivularia sp. UHCC 0363]